MLEAHLILFQSSCPRGRRSGQVQNPFGVENPMIKSIASYTFSTTKRYLTSDYKLINCRAGLCFSSSDSVKIHSELSRMIHYLIQQDQSDQLS